MDSVLQGSSLAPVLQTTKMSELEKIMVSGLINSGLIQIYIRQANYTLLYFEEDDIDNILQQLNAFYDNMKFAIDKFTDSNVNFLIIKIDPGETDLFCRI